MQGAPGQGPPPPPATALDKVAHVLAVWFGCGHVPVAPGLAGTLGAIPLYLLLRPYGPAGIAGKAGRLLPAAIRSACSFIPSITRPATIEEIVSASPAVTESGYSCR